MALGKQVRRLREKLGWTLEKLHDASGVPIGTISAIEVRGSSKSIYAPQLAAAFGVPIELLVTGTEADIDAWLAARQQRKDDADVIDAQVREARENAAPYRLPSARSVDALDAVRSDVQSLPPELREVLAQLVSEYLTADDDRKDVLRVAIERLKGGKYQSDTSVA